MAQKRKIWSKICIFGHFRPNIAIFLHILSKVRPKNNVNRVPRWVFRYVGNKTFGLSSKKKDFLPKNDQIWPKIGIFGQFGPGHAGFFGALLVGRLVVVARGLYLARHLFTLLGFQFFGEMCITEIRERCIIRRPPHFHIERQVYFVQHLLQLSLVLYKILLVVNFALLLRRLDSGQLSPLLSCSRAETWGTNDISNPASFFTLSNLFNLSLFSFVHTGRGKMTIHI